MIRTCVLYIYIYIWGSGHQSGVEATARKREQEKWRCSGGPWVPVLHDGKPALWASKPAPICIKFWEGVQFIEMSITAESDSESNGWIFRILVGWFIPKFFWEKNLWMLLNNGSTYHCDGWLRFYMDFVGEYVNIWIDFSGNSVGVKFRN